MGNRTVQQIIDKIIRKRIADLTEIICMGKEGPAEIATARLAQIGTPESSNMLMFLIEQTEDSGLRDAMSDTLIAFSPLRNDYKDRLIKIYGTETIEALFADAEHSTCLRTMQPLWQTIAEALEVEFAKQLRTAERAANNGILYAD